MSRTAPGFWSAIIHLKLPERSGMRERLRNIRAPAQTTLTDQDESEVRISCIGKAPGPIAFDINRQTGIRWLRRRKGSTEMFLRRLYLISATLQSYIYTDLAADKESGHCSALMLI